MPIGVPRPGGIPMGGPMGGLIPGGGPIMPGGGAPRPIGGGGPARPGGYWVGAPAILAVAAAAAAATVPLPCGVITCWDGPPTPRTGPASPAGAWGIGTPAGIPLPAALPIPGPPAAPASGTRAMPVCKIKTCAKMFVAWRIRSTLWNITAKRTLRIYRLTKHLINTTPIH